MTNASEEISAEDREKRRVLWSLPTGLYILGSRAGDRFNGMTLNEAMQVSSDPKIIAVGVAADSYTASLMNEGGVFSLNILAREDSAMVRKFVKPVAVEFDASADAPAGTLNGFPFTTATTGAPILTQAVAYLDCRITEQHPAGNHTLYMGEVVAASFQRPEDTPILRMEDTKMKYGG